MSRISPKRTPVRTCVGCGQRESRDGLLRLQLGAAGGLVVVERPVRGRSAYVHGRAECVTALAKTRLLRRSLGADVGSGGRAGVIQCLRNRTQLPGGQGVRR
jgi:hypothetical protein